MLLFCALVSCAKKNESQNTSSGGNTTLVHEISTTTIQEATRIAKEAKLLCPIDAPCHPSVALYIATKESGVVTCTSTLVGEDLMLTNSHCIPKEVKTSPENCSKSIHFIFPSTSLGLEEESVKCKELIGFTEIPKIISPDFSLIRLEKKMARMPIHVNQNGIPLGKTLTIYKIDPLKDRAASGRMVRTSCTTAENSILLPMFQKSEDPLLAIGGCAESIPGNSGSPILDQEGKLAAIMQGALSPKDDAARKLIANQMDANDKIAYFSLATNANCLGKDFIKSWQINPNCANLENLPSSNFNGLKLFPREDSEEKISKLISPYLNKLPGLPLQWNRVAEKNTQLLREVTLVPNCFQPSVMWIDNYIKNGKISDFGEISANVPVVATKLILNSNLQPKRVDVFISQERNLVYRFNPAALMENGESTLTQLQGEDNISETSAVFCR